jgi:hypothetical protein
MKYVWTQAQSLNGWGIEGVFPQDVIDNAPRRNGLPVVDANAVIVGTQPGWDCDAIFDKAWMEEACRRMSAEPDYTLKR